MIGWSWGPSAFASSLALVSKPLRRDRHWQVAFRNVVAIMSTLRAADVPTTSWQHAFNRMMALSLRYRLPYTVPPEQVIPTKPSVHWLTPHAWRDSSPSTDSDQSDDQQYLRRISSFIVP